MAYFEFLNHLAWTGPGQEMVPKSMWFNFPPGLDRELARRLGDIGNTAASTYCGIHPADVPYMGGEYQDLPWIWDWFESFERDSFRTIRLRKDMKGQFFSELEGKWAHLCSYREDLIASEEMSSEESELMDVLSYLFSSDLTDTKKDSIQMLCVLVLASVNDGLLCLKNIEFDKAAMHMSNAYQALFHIRSDCEAFVSGRSRGGQLRHLNDPKSKDKKLVFECWEALTCPPPAVPA